MLFVIPALVLDRVASGTSHASNVLSSFLRPNDQLLPAHLVLPKAIQPIRNSSQPTREVLNLVRLHDNTPRQPHFLHANTNNYAP